MYVPDRLDLFRRIEFPIHRNISHRLRFHLLRHPSRHINPLPLRCRLRNPKSMSQSLYSSRPLRLFLRQTWVVAYTLPTTLTQQSSTEEQICDGTVSE